MELLRDTGPEPHEIPADAFAVLVWRDDVHPKRWELGCIAIGAEKLEDLSDAVGKEMPGLVGRPVLATRIGGNSGRVRRLERNENTTVDVVEHLVEAPAEPEPAEPTGR